MAVHRITDAAEAALHRVCPDGKMGEFISQLIVDYERGLTFEGAVERAAKAQADLIEVHDLKGKVADYLQSDRILRGEGRKY